MACFGNSLICKSYVYDESFAQINGTIRVNMMLDSQSQNISIGENEVIPHILSGQQTVF